MALINFIPHNTAIDFVKYRFIPFLIAAVVVVGTLFSLGTRGLNYGIDFLGGYILEVRFSEKPDLSTLREKMNTLDMGEVSLQTFGDAGTDLLIRFERPDDAEATQTQSIAKIKSALGEGVDYRRIETVGPKVGSDLIENSIKAVGLSLIAMLIYIAVRFEWQFALCAIAALLHDCIAIMGMFTVLGFEFKETAIIALLITAGYSINDTIVIFDRIRENIRKFRKKSMPEIINISINDTLSRTVLTASTTLLAVFALYFFGGSVIAEFSLPILVGIGFGTFSSICLASPLLLFFKINRDDDKNEGSKKDESKTIEGEAIHR